MRTIFYFISIIGILGCNYSKNKDSKNLIKTYYDDGSIKELYNIDLNGKYNGYYIEYDLAGNKISKMFYYHGVELSSYFYKNGKINQVRTKRYIQNSLEGYNCIVNYNQDGKIDYDNSYFADIKYLSNEKDSIYIDLRGYFKDSIVIRFNKNFSMNFESTQPKRQLIFKNQNKFYLKLNKTDFENDILFLSIKTFKNNGFYTENLDLPYKVKIEDESKTILVQLRRGEIPAKHNLEPIW